MAGSDIIDMDGFELGAPALVCRWRLSNRRLPLTNRHLRAFLARSINGTPISKALAAWAKQHIEWTLDAGSLEHPNGVLMLLVDQQGRAAMTVGPYEPLQDTSVQGLVRRALRSRQEAQVTGVAPETLWVAEDTRLVYGASGAEALSGATSLVAQLARTMGFEVKAQVDLAEQVRRRKAALDDVFLVSDEHGVVPASDAKGSRGVRMAQGYQRLLERTAS